MLAGSAPPRLACVRLPALPLQIAAQRPSGAPSSSPSPASSPSSAAPPPRAAPRATVDRPGPQAILVHIDDAARRAGARPGMRAASALGLCPDLQIVHVDDDALAAAQARLLALLERFTPRVEASADDPGAFWLDPAGMSRLFGAPSEWAAAILHALELDGWRARVVVGFRRFLVHALARALPPAALAPAPSALPASPTRPRDREASPPESDPAPPIAGYRPDPAALTRGAALAHQVVAPAPADARPPSAAAGDATRSACDSRPPSAAATAGDARPPAALLVLDDPVDEARLADAVPLAALDLPAARLADLAVLEVRSLGDLLRLPPAELRRRFGREVADLHARAAGLEWAPLRPRAHREPCAAAVAIDPPDDDQGRLLFALKGALAPLLDRLAAAGEAARALDLTLHLDHAAPAALRVEPAAPTLDLLALLDLVRLRLATLALAAPVAEISILVDGTRPEGQQEGLLDARPRRDPRAAAAALARLRAAYGDDAVTRPRLRSAHLPEASFTWEAIVDAPPPRPAAPAAASAANQSSATPPLCRRLLARPRPLDPEGVDPDAPVTPPSLRGAEDLAEGPIRRLDGPHRVSGGWWARAVERDYYYAETAGGALLWIFLDRPRRRWFLHGVVD